MKRDKPCKWQSAMSVLLKHLSGLLLSSARMRASQEQRFLFCSFLYPQWLKHSLGHSRDSLIVRWRDHVCLMLSFAIATVLGMCKGLLKEQESWNMRATNAWEIENIFSFYREGNWGSDGQSELPKVIKLANHWTEMIILVLPYMAQSVLSTISTIRSND